MNTNVDVEMEVTVLVICYNSSKTIMETLNSVYDQTYKNLHLIVSDDCSEDDTFSIAKSWIKEHVGRFLSCKCIKTNRNLGISSHMNSCIKHIPSQWFKCIAADDILLPNCVQTYVDFISINHVRGIIYAKQICFMDEHDERRYFIDYEEELYQKKFAKLSSAIEQRRSISEREVLCTPSCFTNKDDVIKAGGFDERIRNIEDWPIKMRVLDSGIKMNRIDEYTVLYRVGNSVSRSDSLYYKPEHIELEKTIKKLYCYPVVGNSLKYRWNESIINLRYYITISILHNKRNVLSKIVNHIVGCLNTDKAKKAIVNVLNKKKANDEIQAAIKKYSL